MSNNNYHIETYQGRVKRLRRLSFLLSMLLCLSLLNFYTHKFKYEQYYNRLQMVLYDFTQEYKEVLLNWCETENGTDANKQRKFIKTVTKGNFVILFQNSNLLDDKIIWDKIPLFISYLSLHAPELSRQNTLFSWELPTPVFLFVAVLIPTFLLLVIAMDLRGLLRIRRLITRKAYTGYDVKLILRSIFYTRNSIKKKEFQFLQTITLGLIFFLCASISSMLFLQAPLFAFREVSGTLYVGSSLLPNLFIGNELPKGLPNEYNTFLLIEFFINLILCALIGKYNIKLNKE